MKTLLVALALAGAFCITLANLKTERRILVHDDRIIIRDCASFAMDADGMVR